MVCIIKWFMLGYYIGLPFSSKNTIASSIICIILISVNFPFKNSPSLSFCLFPFILSLKLENYWVYFCLFHWFHHKEYEAEMLYKGRIIRLKTQIFGTWLASAGFHPCAYMTCNIIFVIWSLPSFVFIFTVLVDTNDNCVDTVQFPHPNIGMLLLAEYN